MPASQIRLEEPPDIPTIREINIEAFRDHPHSHQTEHLIVDALRAAAALDLSLVAVRAGRPIGHIAFSRAAVGEATTGWYVLGPVAVQPSLQRQGIGSALIQAGLQELRARQARGCVLVGDPGYYRRFGFHTIPGVTYDGVPDQYVLCLPFGPDAPAGPIRAHDAFALDAGDPPPVPQDS
jgi:putative acetyltransferase